MLFTKATETSRQSNGMMGSTIQDIENRIEDLRKEIAVLAGSFTAHGKDSVENQMRDYRKTLGFLAEDTLAASAKALIAARDETVALEEAFENRVRQNPIQALGVAIGIGFFAALLMRRK